MEEGSALQDTLSAPLFSYPATHRFFFSPLYAVNYSGTLPPTGHGHTFDTVFFSMAKSGKGVVGAQVFPSITLNIFLYVAVLYSMSRPYFMLFFTCLIHAIYFYLPELRLTFPFPQVFSLIVANTIKREAICLCPLPGTRMTWSGRRGGRHIHHVARRDERCRSKHLPRAYRVGVVRHLTVWTSSTIT
jgi:hypothetical protein